MKPSNDLTLKQALELMMEELKLKPKLFETGLKATWVELMGVQIARQTQDIHLFKRKLIIQILSAPLRHELQMGREKIRMRMNEKLGEDYIQQVEIR